MSTTFVPPRPDQWEGPVQSSGFTPPPVDSWEGPARGGRGGGSGGGRGGRGGGGSGSSSSTADSPPDDGKTGFGGRILQNFNPVPLIDSLAHHPIDTVKHIVMPADAPAQEAVDAFKAGNYGTGVERTLEDVPLFGPVLRQGREDWNKGDYGAIGGTVASIFGPKLLGKAKVKIPIPKTLNPVEESAVNYATRQGIPVDLATATGNKSVAGMQAMAEKQPLMASRVSGLKAAQQQGIQQAGQRISQSVSPTGATDPVAAGESVSSMLKGRVQKLNTVADQSYDALRKAANDPANRKTVQVGQQPSSIIDPTTGKPVMTPIMREIRMPTDYTAVKAQLAPMVEQLEKAIPQAQADASPGLRAMRQILAQPDLVDVDTAIKDLSSIQSIARTAGELPEVRGMSRGLAASMVPRLRSAIDDAAAQAGTGATKALDRGRLATRSKYAVSNVLDALPRNATGEIEPSQVFNRLTRSDDQSVQLLRSVAAKAPKAMPDVSRAYVEGLLNDMVYQGDVRRAQSAVRAWHNLGDETKGLLFDKATQQNITDFVNYAEMVGRRSNPSGTASVAAILAGLHPKVLAAQLVAGKPIAQALFGDVGANPSFPVSLGPIPKMAGATVGGNMVTPKDDIPRYAKGGIIRRPQILVDAETHKPTGLMAEAGPEAIVPLGGETAAASTVPEKPDAIAEQISQLSNMKRRVVMIPRGTFPHLAPEGMATHADQHGNKFIFNPNLIGIHDIKLAVAMNRLPSILGAAHGGMGVPDKSKLRGNLKNVIAKSKSGISIQSSATDIPHIKSAIRQSKKITPKGGTVSVESPGKEIARRQAV